MLQMLNKKICYSVKIFYNMQPCYFYFVIKIYEKIYYSNFYYALVTIKTQTWAKNYNYWSSLF